MLAIIEPHSLYNYSIKNIVKIVGKTPKAVLLEQATKEKDLKELILGLKQDIAEIRELITAQASK